LKHFSKGFLKGKLLAPKLRKSADKSLSQPSCSYSNTIYNVQPQKKRIVTLRMQARCQATLTQPLQCDLQRLTTTGSRRQSEKKDEFEAIFKMIFKRKIIRAKIAQSTPY
jgi:hypothetical protein